ncbi:MAG: hypothetical protein ACO1N1_03400 [Dyadobacter fermentans]
MKTKILTTIALTGLLAAFGEANAQVRQPSPTGQVPKAYTGAQAGQGAQTATFKPKPTGQIAPEVPGQPLGTLPQPAQPAPVKKTSEVQSLGFESYSAPTTQSGMVPKVTTSQDQRVMTERFAPDGETQQRTVTTEQVQQTIRVQQVPAGGTYAPGTEPAPATTTAPVTTGEAVSQPAQSATQAPVTQPATTTTQPAPAAAPRSAPQRVSPK